MKSNLELMQNVVKPYIDAKNQALTNYTADTGVKNILNIYGEKSMSGNVNLTIENNGYSIAVSTSATWQSVRQWIRGLKKNTDYVLSFNFTMESGSPYVFVDNSDGTTIAGLNPPTTGGNVLNFNTGNYTDFQFYFYCLSGTAGTGSVHYADIMVCEKAVYDADPTYQPYAKTNVELTQDVATLNDVTVTDVTSLFTGITSGVINMIKCGRIRQLQFDTVAFPRDATFPTLDVADRPKAYAFSSLTVTTDNTSSTIWIRVNGTFGSNNVTGKTVKGSITWIAS